MAFELAAPAKDQREVSVKISVCGKGGSGKSVIVALLADEIKSRGYHVLVVDSDE